MSAEFEIVDVWAGHFRSRSEFDDYLKETYDEENEEAPVSQFAADQEQVFCDHDFVSGSFRKLSGDFAELCDGLPGGRSWVNAALVAFDASEIKQANTILLAFGRTIQEPRSVNRLNHRLTYLGRFESRLDGDQPLRKAEPVPEFVYLQIQGGAMFQMNGHETAILPIDQRGLILGGNSGRANSGSDSSDDTPYLDLSAWLSGCVVAEQQARICRDQFHQWSFEDLGNNGQTRVSNHEFNGLKTFPWHDQQISIGNLSFRWLNRLAGY